MTERRLVQVEEAKAVMREALNWSVVKWLTEKKKVRRMADQANAELDAAEKQIKDSWSEDLKKAFVEIAPGKRNAQRSDPRLVNIIKGVKDADEQASRAHLEAERTFDEAEEKLSTRLAREGCEKAIQSWELHEKAIRKAEAAGISVRTAR